MAHDALLFGPNAVVQPTGFGINEYSGAPVERPLPSQVAGFGPAEMMNFMTAMMAENERLRTESMKRPRTEKDEEEEGEPPIKIHIVEGYDDAWSTFHHVSRNLRPYCGDWNERFKSLGKKAKPEKECLDWEPMGSLTISHATVKRMHNRGSILTIKMFLPSNFDVQSRASRIMYNAKQKDFTHETLDFKEATETWQIVEALQAYTMALARVWPEDWTGHALQRILTQHRWLANCGKAKASQVKILIGFINHVLAENANKGRQMKQPISYLKIEEAMSDRIWSRGISKSACQTGRDPYSSTPDGSRIMKTDNQSSGNNAKGSGGTNRTKQNHQQGDNFCRGFNSSSGCSYTPCKWKHACSRSLDSNRFCNQTNHGSSDHV